MHVKGLRAELRAQLMTELQVQRDTAEQRAESGEGMVAVAVAAQQALKQQALKRQGRIHAAKQARRGVSCRVVS